MWEVDLDISKPRVDLKNSVDYIGIHGDRIEKQQALIAYDFERREWELKVLKENKNTEIRVNEQKLTLSVYLKAGDVVAIGDEAFFFYLPVA